MMIIGCSILSGIFYRLGGMKGMNTKARDLGVPLCGLATILLLKIQTPWYIHLIAFGLFFASLTTYFDSVPFNKGMDNFWMVGFICALAYLPYAIVNDFWLWFIIRCILCSLLIGGLNYFVNKHHVPFRDWIEELFRGFLLNCTIFLFVI